MQFMGLRLTLERDPSSKSSITEQNTAASGSQPAYPVPSSYPQPVPLSYPQPVPSSYPQFPLPEPQQVSLPKATLHQGDAPPGYSEAVGMTTVKL